MGVVADPQVEVDQSSPPEETESVPEEAQVEPEPESDAAAPPLEEEPAAEPEPEPTYTKAQLEEQARQAREEERQRLIEEREREQRRIQSENGRRAYYQQLEQEQKAERQMLFQAALDRGESPEDVLATYDRKREAQWLDRAANLADEAIVHMAAAIQGDTPVISDPRVQNVYDKVRQVAEIAYNAGLNASSGQIAEQYIPKSELPKLIEAEITRRNAKAREGQKPIQRPEGTPSGGHEQGSLGWWNALTPQERQDPANGRLYDAWLAKNA